MAPPTSSTSPTIATSHDASIPARRLGFHGSVPKNAAQIRPRRCGSMDWARAGQEASSLPLLHPEVEAVVASSSPINRLGARRTNTTGQTVKDAVTSDGEGEETTRTEASRDGKRPNGHKPASNKNLS